MRRLFLVLVALLGLGGLLSPQAMRAQNDTVQIEAGPAGITLTWTPPPISVTNVDIAGQTFSRVEIPGLSYSGQPGQPQLPQYSGLIGLPPDGGAQLRVLDIKTERIPLPHPPLPVPVPRPVSSLDDASAAFGGPIDYVPDAAIYTTDAYFPPQVAQLGRPQPVRNRRTAALSIFPVRVNPVAGQLEVVKSIRLEVRFEQPAEPALAAQAEGDSFAEALAATLLNPAAAGWTAPVEKPAEPAPPELEAAESSTVLKVVVKERGLYALTYTDLQAAGLPVDTLDPHTLQISYGASFQPVPIIVEGEGDGSFDVGDRVLFYAEPEFSRYTDEDVYFLSDNQPTPPRMTSRSGNPQGLPAGVAWRTAHAEANNLYEPLYPGYNGDHWYWSELRQPDKTAATYSLVLASPWNGGPNATLTVWLRGTTNPSQNPDHKVRVQVNGSTVGDEIWDGKLAREATFPVAANTLVVGNNQIRLSLPGVGTIVEWVLLDALEMKYPTASGSSDQLYFEGQSGQKQYSLAGWSTNNLRLFDVTNPLQPEIVTGAQIVPASGKYNLAVGDAGDGEASYLVVPENKIKSPIRLETASLLTDPPRGADYIIITHPDFAAAIEPLANHRTDGGLQVVTVTTRQVYDSFGGGRISPQAIKNFLQHAYQTWTPVTPQYVLLVGDGSYDFKNNSGFNPQMYLPPFLAQVDPWWGETAADNRYVTFDGDNVPEMLIGRLPVNSPAEAGVVVNKIIQYETNPPLGEWNARNLFVAGNRDEDKDPLVVSQIFRIHADEAYNRLAPPFVGYRFYYDPEISSNSYIYSNYVTARQQFISAFNAGASLAVFHGHSSWHQWNINPLFRWSLVETDNDVAHLKNGGRLPVVLGMTCFTGFFHHPEYPTMDESLLRHAGGGAVAVWGATGLGVASGHQELQAGFYDAILYDGETTLGAAVLAGKLNLLATGHDQDLLDTFTLFGDPALTMHFDIVPYPVHLYLPVISR